MHIRRLCTLSSSINSNTSRHEPCYPGRISTRQVRPPEPDGREALPSDAVRSQQLCHKTETASTPSWCPPRRICVASVHGLMAAARIRLRPGVVDLGVAAIFGDRPRVRVCTRPVESTDERRQGAPLWDRP